MKVANNIRFNELLLFLSKIHFDMYAPSSTKYYIMSDDGAGFTPVSYTLCIENKYFSISNHLLTINKGKTWINMIGFSLYTATKLIIENAYKQKIKHKNKQHLQSKLKNQFIKIKL